MNESIEFIMPVYIAERLAKLFPPKDTGAMVAIGTQLIRTDHQAHVRLKLPEYDLGDMVRIPFSETAFNMLVDAAIELDGTPEGVFDFAELGIHEIIAQQEIVNIDKVPASLELPNGFRLRLHPNIPPRIYRK